jgi:murein DD-endopeptidase MepM/ murein hydrolase activator NlpD
MTLRGVAFFLALLCTTKHVQADPCYLNLPKAVPQGGLVKLQANPQAILQTMGRTLRLSAQGQAVFGVGRDQSSPVAIVVKEKTCSRTYQLAVSQRQYNIERVDGVPENTVTPNPQEAQRIAREGAIITAARAYDSERADWQQTFVRPASGRFSGFYGSQRFLNGKPKDPHMGLDIAGGAGAKVFAPADGSVRLAYPNMLLTGNTILLDHGYGISTIYIHLSRMDVKEGDLVKQSQLIGAIGQTGRATGPHLHWGLFWFQVKLDPQLLLSP